MADHIGIVIGQIADNYALVVTDRKGACSGCESTSHSCRSCLASSKMESRVVNSVGAKPGDLVKIHMESSNLFAGAAILYLLPIAGLLLGAFMGTWVSHLYAVKEIIGSVGGAALGLGMGYTLVALLDRRPSIRRQIMPNITAVLSSKENVPDNKKNACCE